MSARPLSNRFAFGPLALVVLIMAALVCFLPRPIMSETRVGLDRVVIDPGHGGGDRGVVGPGGMAESELTLGLAGQLKEALTRKFQAQVFLTREEDRNPPLIERTATANRLKADLFISLHAGGGPFESGVPFRVFYQDYELQMGLRERPSPVLAGPPTIWSLSQAEFLVSSMKLAEELDRSLAEVLRRSSPGPKGAPLAVLAGATQTAVLVELGDLTDPEVERRLGAQGYNDALIRALVRGVDFWKQGMDPEGL